jgi:hypothetical protein
MPSSEALSKYRQKRNFQRTPETEGGRAVRRKSRIS